MAKALRPGISTNEMTLPVNEHLIDISIQKLNIKILMNC